MHRPPSRLFPDCARTAISDGNEDPPPLPPEEADSVQKAVSSRQREFALGRWCARRAIVELGVPPQPIPMGPNRAPRWPDGVVGSITHCRGFVGAVVAPANCLRAIGFDAERADPLDPDLIPLICTDREIAWARAGGHPPADWPKVIFSAKEAIHKCVSPLFGRMLDFLDVTLVVEPDRGVFSAHATTATSAAGVDLADIVGRLAVDERFVFTCAFVEARARTVTGAAT